jgi:hypothetical protein
MGGVDLAPDPEGSPAVIWIVAFMLLILVAAGLVAAYVAYPHRGQQLPGAAWLGDAMRKGVDRLPTLGNQRR